MKRLFQFIILLTNTFYHMTSFIHFLRSECSSIQAFVESTISCEEEIINDIDMKIAMHISHHPRLREFFDVVDMNMNIYVPLSVSEVSNPNTLIPWSRTHRVAG